MIYNRQQTNFSIQRLRMKDRETADIDNAVKLLYATLTPGINFLILVMIF